MLVLYPQSLPALLILSTTPQIPVEALRHRGPHSSQMDTLFQLKMILASINLQKTSGQVVQTHPPMVLLAFSLIINLLFLLSKKAYLLSSHEDPFIVSEALSPLMVGRLFGLS